MCAVAETAMARSGTLRYTMTKNLREKGKKIADKNWVLTAYDENSADGTTGATRATNQGQAAQTAELSGGKVNTLSSDKQESSTESSAAEAGGVEGESTDGGSAARSAVKRRALDTLNGGSALGSYDTGLRTSHQDPVVSFDDAAKIQQDLQNLASRYEQISKEHTFVGELSKALRLRNNGNHSNYGTFEAKNGAVVRIRISDHNAQVKNFDDAGYDNGISIVISRKRNNGMDHNGSAHIVEYFYNGYKLAKADGHPLAEIARSMQQQ